MQIEHLPMEGLALAHDIAHSDARGQFSRLYCQESLVSILGGRSIAQINHSVTDHAGTLRGLHFQRSPHAEMKLIRCLRGAVYDVAVDLRPSSTSFKQHSAVELRAGDGQLLVIPEGFAHGFQTLADHTELLYLHTAPYAASHESGIRYDDPELAIAWPLRVSQISARDANLPGWSANHDGG